MSLILPRRNPLVFPAGVAPGFDPSHFAASGALISWTAANPLVNLVGGPQGSFADANINFHAAPFGIADDIGLIAANSGGINFSVKTAGQNFGSMTFAGIFAVNKIGYPYQDATVISANGTTYNINLGINTNSSIPTASISASYNITWTTTLPALTFGHTYFLVGTYASASGLIYQTLVDLNTGQKWYAYGTFSLTWPVVGYSLAKSGNVINNNGIPVYAAAAISAVLSPQQQAQWAADPLTFWYPKRSLSRKAVTSSSINLTASQAVPAFTGSETLAAIIAAGASQNVPVFTDTETLANYIKATVASTIPDFTSAETLSHSTALNIAASQSIPGFTFAEQLASLVSAQAGQTIPAFTVAEQLAALVKAQVDQTVPAFPQSFSAVVLSARNISGAQTIPGFPQVVTVSDRKKHTQVYIII